MSLNPLPDDAEDTELLAAHIAGDPHAFGMLFTRHRDRLWAVALRTTGNPEDAADALQDALISAFRRAESYRGDSAVTTWLHRIVVNACLDRLRRRKVRAADPLPDDVDVATDPAPGPEEVAVASDRAARVWTALDQIAPDQKSALVLVDLQGFSVDEAAAVLDCAPGTIKSRCSRGRTRLAQLLAPLRADRDDSGPKSGHERHGTGSPAGASHQPGHVSGVPPAQPSGGDHR